MPEITRTASATWTGDLRSGAGRATTPSGVLREAPVTYVSRFESGEGTNPEELIAAAHAACFSMALAGRLTREGAAPERIETTATLTLHVGEAGARIRELAEAAKEGCPVSRLLKPGLESLTVDARLV
jgi:osmotically inducible protein OsmC